MLLILKLILLPATDAEHGFQFRVFVLEMVYAPVHLLVVLFDGLDDQRSAVNIGERVDDVRAQKRVHILRYEIGRHRSVLTPVCHIAHFLVSVEVLKKKFKFFKVNLKPKLNKKKKILYRLD